MATESQVTAHYSHGELLARLNAMLAEDGVDPARPTIEALAPYDQFHGRGLEATEEIAGQLDVAATDHLLDIGSGIGGPARYMARRFGCRVTGIDLTAEFCEVARHLSALMGLDARLTFEEGNALAMPFADAAFDGAYSMNVSMNIEDKGGFYAELHRVLKPGGWLFLSEIALGPKDGLDFPTPWAASADESFLVTPEATLDGLRAAGFEIVRSGDRVAESLDYSARTRAAVAAGGQPFNRAVELIHGEAALAALRNTARATADGRTVPIEIYYRKPLAA